MAAMKTTEERTASAAARGEHAVASVDRGRASVDASRWLLTSSRAALDRPRPSFSGGADSEPDEVDVRVRVRRLIEVGFLSRFGSGRLVAGICRVAHDCTVCGAGIQIGEQEVEIVARGQTVVILPAPAVPGDLDAGGERRRRPAASVSGRLAYASRCRRRRSSRNSQTTCRVFRVRSNFFCAD
jgi:hypothetical protein